LSELNFSRTLVAALWQRGAHVQRIEDKLSQGIPDINMCVNGTELWIETKVFSWPKRYNTNIAITFQPFQLPWLRERISAGGRCLVVARERHNKLVFVFGSQAIKETGSVLVKGRRTGVSTILQSNAEAFKDRADFIGTLNNAADHIISLQQEA